MKELIRQSQYVRRYMKDDNKKSRRLCVSYILTQYILDKNVPN